MTPKADTRQILQTVPRIPAPARKSPKAARTAGRCDQPGVTCDARLLSCFCPSPLNPPLWAALDLGIGWIPGFQIRTGSGLKIHQEAGRTSPASWCLRLCRPSDFRAETVLRHNRPQRPQHRISLPRRCTDCPPASGAHKLSQGPTRDITASVCILGEELRAWQRKDWQRIRTLALTSRNF